MAQQFIDFRYFIAFSLSPSRSPSAARDAAAASEDRSAASARSAYHREAEKINNNSNIKLIYVICRLSVACSCRFLAFARVICGPGYVSRLAMARAREITSVFLTAAVSRCRCRPCCRARPLKNGPNALCQHSRRPVVAGNACVKGETRFHKGTTPSPNRNAFPLKTRALRFLINRLLNPCLTS